MIDADVLFAQIACLLIEIPSVCLYLVECGIILRAKDIAFRTSFFHLFLLNAGINLLVNFFLNIFVWHISQLGLFVDLYMGLPEWVAVFFYSASFFTFHFENLLTSIMIAHRLSAILWPMDFEQVWQKAFRILLPLSMLIPLAMCYPTFWLPMHFMIDENVHFRRVYYTYSDRWTPGMFDAYMNLFITCSVFLSLNLVLNLATIVAYLRHRSYTSNALKGSRERGDEQRDKLEFRLHVYTWAIFAGQFLMAAYYMLCYACLAELFSNLLAPFYPILLSQYIWINDLRVLAFPAWFLFWASGEMNARVTDMAKKLCAKFKWALSKIICCAQTNTNKVEEIGGIVVMRSSSI